MNNEHYRELMEYWLLRLFKPRKYFNKHLGTCDSEADDVLEFLGLGGLEPEKRESMFYDKLKSYEDCEKGPVMSPALAENFSSFAKMLSLRRVEQQVLEFAVLCQQDFLLETSVGMLPIRVRPQYLETIARVLGLGVSDVIEALGPQGRLMGCGIMEWKRQYGESFNLSVVENIAQRLLAEDYCADQVIGYIVKPVPKPSLDYGDFAHIAESLDYLRPYLRAKLHEKARGVNVFIYGPPGTGKTELVRVIGRSMRSPLYEVAYEGIEGEPVKAEARLRSLLVAQNLMRKRKSLLLYDEAEDIFSGHSPFRSSVAGDRKAWVNRLLETNPVPTFWVSNVHRDVDPAFLRRFDFVIGLKVPPREHRLRCLKRICKRTVSESLLQKVAANEQVSPALATKAYSIVKSLVTTNERINPDKAFSHLLRTSLNAQGSPMGELSCHDSVIPEIYGVDMLNTDVDLDVLAVGLAGDTPARVCLYGPPGTGKTCFGHWLARELGKPITLRKASDMLSRYLGDSEKNIAAAFEEAAAEGSVLMIDEVDSFLRDRRDAQRSWEVSQVNEMLTQMERFNGVFIASTNLMEGLDPASLRRFDLKVKMDYLKNEQLRKMLHSWCDHLRLGDPEGEVFARLDGLTNATPGDFANAVRQHRFNPFASPDELVDVILRECAMKQGGAKGRLGFG